MATVSQKVPVAGNASKGYSKEDGREETEDFKSIKPSPTPSRKLPNQEKGTLGTHGQDDGCRRTWERMGQMNKGADFSDEVFDSDRNTDGELSNCDNYDSDNDNERDNKKSYAHDNDYGYSYENVKNNVTNERDQKRDIISRRRSKDSKISVKSYTSSRDGNKYVGDTDSTYFNDGSSYVDPHQEYEEYYQATHNR